MASFEQQMNDLLKQVQELVPDENMRQKANQAGAKVFKKNVEQVAKNKHYRKNVKDPNYKHMANNVSTSNVNEDGIRDGSVTVGWRDARLALRARFTNDGTVKMKGDQWLDKVRRESATAVFNAQEKVLKDALTNHRS